MQHGNKFYDLETYDVLFEFPDRPTFHLYGQVGNGEWEICDELYRKLLLVEVGADGSILSHKDVTAEREKYEYEPPRMPNTYQVPGTYPAKFPSTAVEEDEDVQNKLYKELKHMAELSSCSLLSDSTPGDLENYPQLFGWMKKQSARHGEWRIDMPRTYGRQHAVMLTRHWNTYFLTFLDNTERYATYLFCMEGKILNPQSYHNLIPIADKHALCPGKLLFFDGIMKAISIDKSGHLQETPYLGTLLKDWQSPLYRYQEPFFPSAEPHHYDVSTTFLMKPADENEASDYPANTYYDIFLHPLNARILEEEMEIQAVVDKYLYKTPNGLWWESNRFDDLSKPFRSGDTVFIPSRRSQELTPAHWHACSAAGRPMCRPAIPGGSMMKPTPSTHSSSNTSP